MSKLTTTLGTAAFVLASNAYAVNPNSGQTSTGQTLNVEITAPTSGADLDINAAVDVEGRVNIGNVPSTGRSNVAFVIDVSFSTQDEGNDCNNDGQVNAGDNFTPSDDDNGTILDCEVGAVMALNDSLGANQSVSTAIILFGTSAATAQDFVSPPNSDSNGDGVSDIDEILVQTEARGGPVTVGGTTDFADALTELTRLMNTRPADEQRVAYFLTDGQDSGSITAEATAARDAGIRIETFSVGVGAASCANSSLNEIANITGGSCTNVQDINTLAAVIENTGGVPPTGIDRVALSINGGAANDVTVDNLGNWQGTIAASELASGANTLEATVFAEDGTAVIADLTFNGLDTAAPDPVDPVTPVTPVTPVAPVAPVTPVAPVAPMDPVTPMTPAVERVYCASAASDSDGDGFGFENGQSCRVRPMMAMGPMICANGSASDPDGDGWGWETGMSCLVQGSAADTARTVFPACTSSDSDSDGDGFGFENNASCVVPGSAASMLVD